MVIELILYEYNYLYGKTLYRYEHHICHLITAIINLAWLKWRREGIFVIEEEEAAAAAAAMNQDLLRLYCAN